MEAKKHKSLIIRALSFIAAVVIITYCLPRSDERRYVYEVNRPWGYQLLTAPFDIPVYLDAESAERVRDSIDNTFEPVYMRNPEIAKDAVNAFAQRLYSAKGIDLTHSERNQVVTELKKVYAEGIVNQATYAEITSGELPAVKIIIDNIAVSTPTGHFLSERAAYSHIDTIFRAPRFSQAFAETKLAEAIQPNVVIDSTETERMHTELYRKAMAPRGVIQQGERIIDQGEVVSPQTYTVLQTYEQMLNDKHGQGDREHYYPMVGQLLYLIIIFALLYTYLAIFRPEYFADYRKMLFIMLVITAIAVFAFILNANFANGLYIVPITLVPVLVLVFLDSRTALFCHLVEMLIVAPVAGGPLEFLFMQFVAGTIAIESINEISKRSQLIRGASFVFLGYCVSYLAVILMQQGQIERIQPAMFGCFVINAVLLSFAYLLIFLMEKMFGFTSKVTLVELSDINNPLLRELSEECPGTFQHSMAVSNLASAAASRIGANVQLVRTGALYHDIGKISNPAFFTENQHGVNPHDALDPTQSARIVVDHVTDGLRLAEKAKLPEVIRRFISEHHGKGTARYFYNTYCNQHPGEDVDINQFSYPGPNPTSRETSILMMADAVEASSRSLKEHTPEAISALVNRIIDTQIAEGLHNDSPLSFRDIKAIKDTFITRLRTMYHSRISYPDKN